MKLRIAFAAGLASLLAVSSVHVFTQAPSPSALQRPLPPRAIRREWSRRRKPRRRCWCCRHRWRAAWPNLKEDVCGDDAPDAVRVAHDERPVAVHVLARKYLDGGGSAGMAGGIGGEKVDGVGGVLDGDQAAVEAMADQMRRDLFEISCQNSIATAEAKEIFEAAYH